MKRFESTRYQLFLAIPKEPICAIAFHHYIDSEIVYHIQFTILCGGNDMPSVSKALATITAWILFIVGCLTYIITLVTLFAGGVNSGEWMHTVAFFTFATISLIAAVVAMKLRQTMG
jgi:hypothetical protein